ncbi:Uncharacterised protein [uncultured archaeon]|nr:Uncharacterised protein [uncultured archaeon]
MVVAVVAFVIYACLSYASLAGEYSSLVQGYLSLQGKYFALASRYVSLNASESLPLFVFVPHTAFYVGNVSRNLSGMTLLPNGYVFCPKSPQLLASSWHFAYANVTPGEKLNYTLVFDAQSLDLKRVVVLPPFHLVSYNYSVSKKILCSDPDAIAEVALTVQAPSFDYTGQLQIVLYRQ